MVNQPVKRASKLKGGILKTATGRGRMNAPDIQKVIEGYGVISSCTIDQPYGKPSFQELRLDILLLHPPGTISADNREVRSELYLQAESIIEIIKRGHVQFITVPRITLGGTEGAIEGTLELHLVCLWKVNQLGTGPRCYRVRT
jgi:hypothetical protein